MALMHYEELLARLYTQYTFRRTFFEDRRKILQNLHVGSDVVKKLLDLNKDEVEFFARGLINKRWGVVKGLMPLSFYLMEEKLKQLFFKYALDTPIQGMHYKHFNDAIRFADFLLKMDSDLFIQIPYLKDIIKLERLRSSTSIVHKKILFEKFSYEVLSAGKESLKNKTIRKKTTCLLLIRLTSDSTIKTFSW